ncbi:MAG: hypothetical protein Q9166_004270 [cf. Caloplaca sp. 2 TL-2023]
MHFELGDAWLHLTPFTTTLYLADAVAAQVVYKRKDDFQKPTHLFRILGLFGRNIMSSDGPLWQLHRKITAPTFNERNSALVWEESIKQAQEVVDTWSQQGLQGTYDTHEDSMTLAFHVLANTSFGSTFSLKDIEHPPRPTYTMTWSRATNIVRDNMLLVAAIPSRILSLPFAPASWTKAGRAVTELRRYMEESLEQERQNLNHGFARSGNLLSSLVRSLGKAKEAPASCDGFPSVTMPCLSRADVLGDIYVFSLAGHATTGNAFTFAIYLLAAHPEVQAWVQEEIDSVYACEASWSESNYELFPKLKRCLAVMLETLRLFPAVVAVPKYTRKQQKLHVNGQELVIPAKTLVILNTTAIHTHPKYWGEDSLIWRPSRWIESSNPSTQTPCPPGDMVSSTGVEGEELRWPEPGTFFPWSDGSRVCPGMRQSKVEFVAVLSTLLRQHHVAPSRLTGEGKEEARRRALSVLADCRFAITLYMANPRSVAMCWIPRPQAGKTQLGKD